jgi:hypothetical protein
MNTGSSSSESICFIANTYISTQQGNRQFVRDDALSNPQLAGNKVLAALMADELQQLRVSRSLKLWGSGFRVYLLARVWVSC